MAVEKRIDTRVFHAQGIRETAPEPLPVVVREGGSGEDSLTFR